MWAKRAQEYLAKINSGDLDALAEVVRDLQAAGDGSGSSFSQRNLFELAIDRLAAEFAAVNRTAKAGAVDQLTQAAARGKSRRQPGRASAPPASVRDPGDLRWQSRHASLYARTALFSVGCPYLVYATPSHFGAPNMKSIPVHAVWIAGLHGG